jgi:hypothetical protein
MNSSRHRLQSVFCSCGLRDIQVRRGRLATRRDRLWRRCVPGRDKGGPGLAGFGVILGGSAGNRRNADQVMAVGALDLQTRCLLVALQVLLTVRTGESELVHRFYGLALLGCYGLEAGVVFSLASAALISSHDSACLLQSIGEDLFSQPVAIRVHSKLW